MFVVRSSRVGGRDAGEEARPFVRVCTTIEAAVVFDRHDVATVFGAGPMKLLADIAGSCKCCWTPAGMGARPLWLAEKFQGDERDRRDRRRGI